MYRLIILTLRSLRQEDNMINAWMGFEFRASLCKKKEEEEG